MKTRSIRRAAALATIASTVLAAAACGKGASSKSAPATADSLANAYKASALETDIALEKVSALVYDKASGKTFIRGRGEGCDYKDPDVVFVADSDLKNAKKIDLGVKSPENGDADVAVRFGADGNLYAFVISKDYGDYKLPDVDDPDFDAEKTPIDYEEIEKHAQTSAYIKSCKPDGTEIATVDIDPEWVKDLGARDFVSEFAALSDDGFAVEICGAEDSVLTFIGKDGKIKKKVDFSDEYLLSFAPASSGELAALINSDDGGCVRFFTADGEESSREKVSVAEVGYSGAVAAVPADYDAAYTTEKGFFGLKDGKSAELLNFANSDIDYYSIGGLAPLDNGEFLIAENSEGSGVEFSRLAARGVDELKNVKLITVGVTWEDPNVTMRINEYNKKNTGYRVKLVRYGDENDDYENYAFNAVSALQKDIVSGKGPDIVITDDRGLVTNLGRKGAFADMYKLLENDPDLKKEDILPNILKAGEADGKLVGLIPCFDVSTMVVKKKVKDGDSWTIDDVVKAYEERPANSEFITNASKDDVLSSFLYAVDSFVDEENAKCSFDGDEFIKLLKFANNFPGEYEDLDYENMTEEDWRNFMSEESLAYRNDKYMVMQTNLDDMKALKRNELATFGEPISVVGFPGARGDGASLTPYDYISVMENSAYKEQCWEFVKSFFTPENQQNIVGIPSLRSAFDEFVKTGTEKSFYIDEKGEKVYFDDTAMVGDKEIKIPLLTQEECDATRDYILGAEAIGQAYSAEIYKIIGEETKPYFAGEKAAEQAAEAIQNRVSILLSERS